MSPQNAPFHRWLDPQLIYYILSPHESASQTGLRYLQSFCTVRLVPKHLSYILTFNADAQQPTSEQISIIKKHRYAKHKMRTTCLNQ